MVSLGTSVFDPVQRISFRAPMAIAAQQLSRMA